MGKRAVSSGIVLTVEDVAITKGMLIRGDRQHDVAAWFGVNGGRVAEIATGSRFANVVPAGADALPPPGPYPAGRVALAAMTALSTAKIALANAEALVRRSMH